MVFFYCLYLCIWSNVIYYIIFDGKYCLNRWNMLVSVERELTNNSKLKATRFSDSWNFQLYSVIFNFKWISKPFWGVLLTYTFYKKKSIFGDWNPVTTLQRPDIQADGENILSHFWDGKKNLGMAREIFANFPLTWNKKAPKTDLN